MKKSTIKSDQYRLSQMYLDLKSKNEKIQEKENLYEQKE